MENILTYQETNETIRQMPQNYIIAEKINGKWICDPDPAADKKLVLRVFNELFDNHNSRWGTGLNLLSKVTPNKEFNCPEWVTVVTKKTVKELWSQENVNNSNPKVKAVKLIQSEAKTNGYEINIKKSEEIIKAIINP